MKPALKRKWIRALQGKPVRNGLGKIRTYRKATEVLIRRSNQMCCLGVLEDLLERNRGRGSGLRFWHHPNLITLNDNHRGWKKVIEYIKAHL